ncbi:MAG: hypothetical protein IKT43_01525 [Clostridia bacterium]|nr:hypothetical protein [Clostridia bacterium]
MIKAIYLRAWNVLKKKPFMLWGISLLAGILDFLGSILFGVIPGVGLAISFLLSTSMTMIYLRGYRGEEPKTEDLFACFKDKKVAIRVACGMGWMTLWIVLWALIPIVGIFFAINRAYAYRLTPYILVTEPDVSITQAIKVSRARTMGYKGKMFGAEVLFYVIVWAASLVFTLFARIPVIGVLFALVNALVSIAAGIFGPLFLGIVQAAFYEEISNPTMPIAPQIPVNPQA